MHDSKFVWLQRGLYRAFCHNTSTLLLIWQRVSPSSFVIWLAEKMEEEPELWEMGVCSAGTE